MPGSTPKQSLGGCGPGYAPAALSFARVEPLRLSHSALLGQNQRRSSDAGQRSTGPSSLSDLTHSAAIHLPRPKSIPALVKWNYHCPRTRIDFAIRPMPLATQFPLSKKGQVRQAARTQSSHVVDVEAKDFARISGLSVGGWKMISVFGEKAHLPACLCLASRPASCDSVRS